MFGECWCLLRLFFFFVIFPVDNILPSQSHYMVEALEEHSMQEFVDHNLAIKALKKEIDILEVEKTQLAREVGGLRIAQAELGEL